MKKYGIAAIGLLLLGVGCADAGMKLTMKDGPDVTASVARTGDTLDLSGQGLKKIDLSVFDRTELRTLDVSHNGLTGALPSQIQRLQDLRELDASDNAMTGVPAEIGQLSKLEELDLSNNQLTGLPSELGNLQQLRRLDLRGNAVSRQDLDGIRAKLTNTEILE